MSRKKNRLFLLSFDNVFQIRLRRCDCYIGTTIVKFQDILTILRPFKSSFFYFLQVESIDDSSDTTAFGFDSNCEAPLG